MVRLNDLEDEQLVIEENSGYCEEASYLKDLVESNPASINNNWYTARIEQFRFDAKEMIEDYLTDAEENGEGYEDMADNCMNSILQEEINKVQQALDEITNNSTCFEVYHFDEKIDLRED